MIERRKDLILYRIERAHETLEDAHILAISDRWNVCVNRLYYACFYAVSALLSVCTKSLFRHNALASIIPPERRYNST